MDPSFSAADAGERARATRSNIPKQMRRDTNDLDFGAIELLHGPSLDRYRRLREDRFALLRQDVDRTATANSDSLRSGEVAGAPRNLIRVEDDASLGMTVWFPHEFARGAFMIIEVEGRANASYARRLPGFTPFAFTHPVFVDADGKWTPLEPLETRCAFCDRSIAATRQRTTP